MRSKADAGNVAGDEETSSRLWLLVIGLAVLFLIYGLFVFFLVGHKGGPDWNFGNLEDTPGKSFYSTSPQPTGNTDEPERQHISDAPSKAKKEMQVRTR